MAFNTDCARSTRCSCAKLIAVNPAAPRRLPSKSTPARDVANHEYEHEYEHRVVWAQSVLGAKFLKSGSTNYRTTQLSSALPWMLWKKLERPAVASMVPLPSYLQSASSSDPVRTRTTQALAIDTHGSVFRHPHRRLLAHLSQRRRVPPAARRGATE